MPRRIITARDLAPATFTASGRAKDAGAPDGYREKLIKYIPAEVVTFYITADLAIRSSASKPGVQVQLIWIVFGFLLVMTPLYLSRLLGVERRLELFLSTVAFAIWVFAMGGPFLCWPWFAANRIVGGLVLMAYTFAIPVIDPDTFAKKKP